MTATLKITDLKDLLQSIGYEHLTDDGRFWRTAAIYRGGDNRTSLRVNKATGQWQDFVDKRFGSIEDLVKLTLGLGDVEFKSFCEGNFININELVVKREKPQITMDKTWTDVELTNLLPHYKFYEDKGISKETLKFLRAGMAHSGSLNQRFVFPIYGKDGKIHGWSGRDLTGKKEAKWKHIGRKANWVYPAYVPSPQYDATGKTASIRYPVIEAIQQTREVNLVESIGDDLALFEYGQKNTLVTFGLVVSPRLGSFLMNVEVDRINVCFNNDIESDINRGKEAALKAFIDLMHYVDVSKLNVVLPRCNDFGVAAIDDMVEWDERRRQPANKQLYKELLDLLTLRYRNKTITKAEIKFGRTIKTLHDEA